MRVCVCSLSLLPAALQPTVEPVTLPMDSLAQSELSSEIQIGHTSVPIASVSGFQVGGVVRLHSGYPNQEDHRIRAISQSSLWLDSLTGVEFPHFRSETVSMLAVAPDCPANCSSIAPCVDRACVCPVGRGGADCSILMTPCEDNCHGNGLCIAGVCSCHAGYTGGSCQYVAQMCPFNCSGHGLCSEQGVCSCEPGYVGDDCSTARRNARATARATVSVVTTPSARATLATAAPTAPWAAVPATAQATASASAPANALRARTSA